MTRAAHAGIQPTRLPDFLPRTVPAGVVHEDEFKLARFLVQRTRDFARERQDVVLLVENRNDDGDVGRHEPTLTVEG